MCFGQRFTWVTDCYAIKFILSYDGRNPSILRLQMRFMCWDMDIEHRNDTFLGDADYWSRLGADLCFDPLLKTYIEQVNSFRQRSPSPTALPPSPANMRACLPKPPPLPIIIIRCTPPSPSMARTRLVSNTSQITPFDLGLILSLEPVMSTPHGPYTIQMSPSRQASYRNSTGLCTDLTTAISPR